MTVSTAPPSTSAVAALGLAGTEHPLRDRPVDPADWAVLRSEVRLQRLTGVLLAAVEQGAFPATDSQVAELVEDHVQAMAGALMLERLLVGVVACLQADRLDFRVLDGPAVAHLDYAAPEHRSFNDINLLVRSDQGAAAARALQDFGLSRSGDFHGVEGDPPPGSAMQFLADDGATVWVHRSLGGDPVGQRVQCRDVWGEAARRFVLGGVEVRALSRELRLLSAAYAAVSAAASPAPARLRDVAQIALQPELDTALAIELASGWRGRAVLAASVRSAWTQMRIGDVTVLSAWAESYRPTDQERRQLALQEAAVGAGAGGAATVRTHTRVAARVHHLWSLRSRDGGAQRAFNRVRRAGGPS